MVNLRPQGFISGLNLWSKIPKNENSPRSQGAENLINSLKYINFSLEPAGLKDCIFGGNGTR